MARCAVSLLAKSVSVDPFSNALAVIDIAENLVVVAPEVPNASEETPHIVSPFSWVFVVLLARSDPNSPEELKMRLTIVSPNGREFPGTEQRVDLATAGFARTFIVIPGMPYTGNGVYRFRVETAFESEWRPIAESQVPLSISTQDPHQAPPPNP
jgi:hypothetical protein